MDPTRGEQTRDQLLAVGLQLFSERGYEAVSIRDLAQAAGVNLGAVNYHFGQKKKLYFAVFDYGFKLMLKDQPAQHQSLPKTVEELESFLRGFVSSMIAIHMADPPHPMLKLLHRELSDPQGSLDTVAQEIIKPIANRLQQAIKSFLPEYSQEQLFLCVASVVGQILHYSHSRPIIMALSGRQYDATFQNEVIDHITQFSIQGLGIKQCKESP